MLPVFIVVHNTESIKRFEQLNPDIKQDKGVNVKYLCVKGMDRFDRETINRGDVIFLNSLKDNIEELPSLLTFTAWYAVARNRSQLIPKNCEHVAILEYDCSIFKPLSKIHLSAIPFNTIVSFVQFRMDHPLFLEMAQGLSYVLDLMYNINAKNLVSNYEDQTNDIFWGCTTNHILPVNFLCDFVDWYYDLVPHIFDYPNHPHFHERAIKIYQILSGHKNIYLPQFLSHYQENSHGINV